MIEYSIGPLQDESWSHPAVKDILKPECTQFTQENPGRVNVSKEVY